MVQKTVRGLRVWPTVAGDPYTIVLAFEDEAEDRFLVVRHRARGWELPGGRLRQGEDPVAGARREFLEETGRALLRARLLVTRGEGGNPGWIFTGVAGPQTESRQPGEVIVESRWVARLREVAPLSFPSDPYDEMEQALGRRIQK